MRPSVACTVRAACVLDHARRAGGALRSGRAARRAATAAATATALDSEMLSSMVSTECAVLLPRVARSLATPTRQLEMDLYMKSWRILMRLSMEPHPRRTSRCSRGLTAHMETGVITRETRKPWVRARVRDSWAVRWQVAVRQSVSKRQGLEGGWRTGKHLIVK